MFVDGAMAGEAYGVPMAGYAEHMPGAELVVDDLSISLYCFSNTVLPAFQRRGLGEVLKAHWLGMARQSGFRVIYGHARPGASQGLNAKFGARFLGDFPDWYGTGETYRLYRLELGAESSPAEASAPIAMQKDVKRSSKGSGDTA